MPPSCSAPFLLKFKHVYFHAIILTEDLGTGLLPCPFLASFIEHCLSILLLDSTILIFALGGAYYLISRSLGPEFGGSIGIIFSLANAIGVALYVVGFAETIQKLMAVYDVSIIDPVNDVRIIGLVVVVLLVGITLIGLEWVVRAQLLLLAILLLSMADYFFGAIFGPLDISADTIKAQGYTGFAKGTFSENFVPTFRGENFFTVFSIFFPAATGILAGANISGDLKDPQSAVPKGTLLAILITTVTYVGFVWIIGASTLKDVAMVVCANAAGNMTSSLNGTITPTACTAAKSEYGLLNDFKVSSKLISLTFVLTCNLIYQFVFCLIQTRYVARF